MDWQSHFLTFCQPRLREATDSRTARDFEQVAPLRRCTTFDSRLQQRRQRIRLSNAWLCTFGDWLGMPIEEMQPRQTAEWSSSARSGQLAKGASENAVHHRDCDTYSFCNTANCDGCRLGVFYRKDAGVQADRKLQRCRFGRAAETPRSLEKVKAKRSINAFIAYTKDISQTQPWWHYQGFGWKFAEEALGLEWWECLDNRKRTEVCRRTKRFTWQPLVGSFCSARVPFSHNNLHL